jgi:hypothetical protein
MRRRGGSPSTEQNGPTWHRLRHPAASGSFGRKTVKWKNVDSTLIGTAPQVRTITILWDMRHPRGQYLTARSPVCHPGCATYDVRELQNFLLRFPISSRFVLILEIKRSSSCITCKMWPENSCILRSNTLDGAVQLIYFNQHDASETDRPIASSYPRSHGLRRLSVMRGWQRFNGNDMLIALCFGPKSCARGLRLGQKRRRHAWRSHLQRRFSTELDSTSGSRGKTR